MAMWAQDKIKVKDNSNDGFIKEPNRMWCLTIIYEHEFNNENCYRTYEAHITSEEKEILCMMLKLMYKTSKSIPTSSYIVPFNNTNFIVDINYGWLRPKGAWYSSWKSGQRRYGWKPSPKPFPFEESEIQPLLNHLFQWKE